MVQVRATVRVLFAPGFDTKYAFPGAMPHLVDYIATPEEYGVYYEHQLVHQGVIDTNRIGYSLMSPDFATVVGDDIQGEFNAWSVSTSALSGAQVLSVSLNNDRGFPHYLYIGSFSGLTPDDLMSSLLASDRASVLVLEGNTGNDTLRGSFWHDEFDGGKGADQMIGGDGDDKYFVDNKRDNVVESAGDGRDKVVSSIDYTLSVNLEKLSGIGSRDLLLTGNGKGNEIVGSTGDDTIKGLDGSDSLIGGLGKDVLTGGKGKDLFYFLTPPSSSNVDTIKDFSHKDDFIFLSRTAHFGVLDPAAPPGAMPLPPSAFHASKSGKAHDATDRILYDTDDGKLYFDADGTGDGQRKLIASFSGHPNVGADDVFIV
jgi:Ca2+-binding RTX toxin-like protein